MSVPIISFISPNSAYVNTGPIALSIQGNNFTSDCQVSFAGQIIDTTFLSSSNLSAVIPNSAIQNFTLGSITVSVQNFAGNSNTVEFQVLKNSNTNLNKINQIAQGINLSNIQDNSQVNPYLKKINNVISYIVKSDDTLQSIAEKVLGDTSRWFDIAIINNLRFPFISSNEDEIQGTYNYTSVLTQPAFAGQNTIAVNSFNQSISTGSVLFFSLNNPLSNGQLSTVSDVVTVTSVSSLYNASYLTIQLDSSLNNNYVAGTSFNVLNSYSNNSSRVVSPGSIILIPQPNSAVSVVKSDALNINEVDLILGTDLAFDDSGDLTISNGDLAVVSGFPNLQQALQNRLETEKGELVYHPDYGNGLLAYLGTINGFPLVVFANKEITRTLLADPRVYSVSSISTQANGDVLSVTANINVNISNSTQQFNFILVN